MGLSYCVNTGVLCLPLPAYTVTRSVKELSIFLLYFSPEKQAYGMGRMSHTNGFY